MPASLFLGIREKDQKLVGIIQLRHHINYPILLTWGGHVGYSVLPSERNKGYAKEILRLVLQEARNIGMSNLLVTCQKDNIASEKTILFNGGVFEKEVDYEGTIYKRFWIEL